MTGAGDLLSSLPLFVGALVGVSCLVFFLSPFCELLAFEEGFLREESFDFALYGLLLELELGLELELDDFPDILEIRTSLTWVSFLCCSFW